MKPFSQTYQVRWADLDPNRHMRHSAFNDYATQVRTRFFYENGIDTEFFTKNQCGVVLFREETLYFKEVAQNEEITIDMKLAALSKDGDRWKIVQHVYKTSGQPAAKITVEGAWFDLVTRKLIKPPAKLLGMVNRLTKTDDFEKIQTK
jgi:acyl-CoA thioester hydrolase